jgi:putative adhesin
MPDHGYTQTISTAGFTETPTLALEQPTGDVHVESWDRPEIQVSISDEGIFEIEQNGSQVVVKNRPGKFKLVDFLEPAADELRELGVDLSRMASDVERNLQRGVHRGMKSVKKMGRNINIDIDLSNWRGGRDYNIMVPHNCDLILRTSSGDLSIVGVTGTHSLQSTSGDVRVRDMAGNTLISTASGDIGIEDVKGKLATRTASGDIRTKNLGLSEVSATTASGDLELDLNRLPEGNFEVRTVSGDLNLYLPPSAAFRAQVHTLSGSVRCGFPREVVDYTSSQKRETVLNVNGGGRTIQLHTVSGDVSIRIHKDAGQSTGQTTEQPNNLSFTRSPGNPTTYRGGQPTMDLSRSQNQSQPGAYAATDETHGDITQSEGYAARQQAELEILQQVERGEITPQEALTRLSALESE